MKFVRRAIAPVLLLLLASPLLLAAAPARGTRPAAGTPAAPPKPARAVPAVSAPRPAEGEGALDQIAAMVNDEAVLASEVEEQLFAFLQRTGARPDSMQSDTLRRQILDQLIDEKLLLAEAKRQNITATDLEIARAVDAGIAETKDRLGGEAAFREQLQRENSSEAELRERFRSDAGHNLVVQKLLDRQIPKRPVPAAEAATYFEAHKDKFPKVPGEMRLSVIQLPPDPDSSAIAAGYARAVAVRKRIVAGEKFAKVAQEVSEDPASARAGGDLGYFPRGAMEKPVDDAAFGQKLNDIGPPVRTSYGWHIVQALDRDTLRSQTGRDTLDAEGHPILEAHARHVLIRVSPTEADVNRTKALAQRIRDEAAKGTSFATLVRRYSHYQGPATPDGDVGFVSLANLQPQIRQGLDSLETGQVSEVLTNQTGFNIFKVTDRHPEREYTIDEIRQELPAAVAEVQFREKYAAWLKTLRAKAQVEYRNY